jgi:hypothetical protein
VGPRLGGRRVDLQEGIEDHLGGVKVDGAGVGGAVGEPGQQPGPEPALGRGAAEAGEERRLGVGDRCDAAGGAGQRQAAEGEADEVEDEVGAGGVAAAAGLGEGQRAAAVEGGGGEEGDDLGVAGGAVAGKEAAGK